MAGLSQETLSRLVGWSQPEVSRFEHLVRRDTVTFDDLARVASNLGLELVANLFPVGDPVRDKGHQALLARLRAILATAWRVVAEMPLPNVRDARSWDLGLRLAAQRVGVEAETAIRDVPWLVRRMRERERDGGMDEVLLLLADSRANRALLPQLLEALGSRFQTPTRGILRALREGRPVPGSGVILL
jgi:transcriptional regulator with XRE-family HTH domain